MNALELIAILRTESLQRPLTETEEIFMGLWNEKNRLRAKIARMKDIAHRKNGGCFLEKEN